MDSKWQAFLEDAGAVFEDGTVIHFGNPQREIRIGTSGGILCDLSHRGLILAEGDDAMTFLQGQLTNDIAQVNSHRAQLSGYCTPQGRLLAVFRIFLRNHVFHMELPRSLLEPTLERLRKYVLMSRVRLEYGGECLVRIGYAAPEGDAELAEALPAAPPSQPFETLETDDFMVLRLPGPVPRFVIYGQSPAMEKLWTLLDVRAAPVGRQVWDRLDILAGLPDIEPQTVEAFLPQAVNLDLLDGVSFKKGCYTGQEIVARLHYRGKVKRRMRRVHVQADTPPPPGTPILGRNRQAAGSIVLAAPSPEGGCDALAVLANDQINAPLCLKADGEPALDILQLPYALPEE